MIRTTRALLTLTLLCLPSGASTIFYDFSGTSVVPSYTLQFQYTSLGFITADTFIPASALDSCSAPPLPCYGVNFLPSGPDTPQHYPELTFQLLNPDNSVGTFFFYLPPGSSFATVGTITSSIGISGTLVISDVPEPTSGLLVLAGGLPMVALLPKLRYRKRN